MMHITSAHKYDDTPFLSFNYIFTLPINKKDTDADRHVLMINWRYLASETSKTCYSLGLIQPQCPADELP